MAEPTDPAQVAGMGVFDLAKKMLAGYLESSQAASTPVGYVADVTQLVSALALIDIAETLHTLCGLLTPAPAPAPAVPAKPAPVPSKEAH